MPFWTVLAAVLSIASGAVSYIQARKAQKAAKKANDEQRGVLVNKESNIEQIPVIYGERRVGGVRVFVSTDGTYKTVGGETKWHSGFHPETESYDDVSPTPTNEYLYIALVMAEGEVESITDFIIDDLPITDPKYSGLVGIDVYLGGDDQVMPDTALLREANEFWTAEHRLRGVAFIGVRLKWDEEAFSGIPDITAVVKGKKVYDPRTDTTAWSDNPALCIRDYLTNTRYGKGLPLSAIDDPAIIAAANACDESVTLYDGGGSGKLFTCNVVLDTSKTLFDNLNTLLLGCRGFLPYSQGQYRLKIDGSRSSEFTFTNDTIIGGIQIKGESKDEKFNRVTVKFPNPDANWQPDTAIWPPADSAEETAYLAEDGGVLLHEELELDTITNYYQARDLARVILLRSRNAITCAIKTTSEALQLEVADVVSITHSTPGWVAKPFQVIGMQLNDDGTVDLALLEYDSTIYTWEEGTEQTAYPDTNLPDPFTVGVVSNITVTETTTLGSDGTVIPTGLIEWDVSYDRLVNQYEIQYKLTSEADTEFKSIFTSVPKYEFYNAEVGISVTIRIRAINSLNVKGAFTSTTFTVNGDVAAPGVATSVTAAAGYRYNTVSWTNPTDKDLARVDVYAGNTSGSGSATLIGSISGDTFVEGGLNESQIRYYYLKTVDFSGNESDFSAGASATTLADPTDGEQGTRSASGYVYYSTATATAPASPTLSGFNFVTGAFTTISAGWSTAVSVPTPEEGKSFWAVRYSISEDTFEGTQTVTKSAVFEWQNFDGIVTFTNMNDEFDNNVTVIDGGKITANTITVDSLRAGSTTIASGRNFYLGTGQLFEGYQSVVGAITTASATSGFAGESLLGFGVIGIGTSTTGNGGFFRQAASGYQTTLATSSYSLFSAGNGGSLIVGKGGTYPNEFFGSVDIEGSLSVDNAITTSSIGSFGSISCVGTFTAFSTSSLSGTVSIGGGYGSSGVTLSSTGNGSFNGNVIVDGSLSVGSFNPSSLSVSGSATIGGSLTVGSFNPSSLNVSGSATIGGGYGSSGMTFQSDGTGFIDGNWIVDGSITAGGNVTAYSDAKLKTNLQVINSPLDKVAALTGYTFDRIDTGETQTGLIAQDVLKVLPEAVGYAEDGTLTLAYGNLVGLLVEAIKELKGEIEELKRGSSD